MHALGSRSGRLGSRREEFEIDLRLQNLPWESGVRLTHYRIDAGHSNAYAEWVKQGRPDWLNEGQRTAIEARSHLEYYEAPEVLPVHVGLLEKRFYMPTHGISLMEIRKI